MQGTCSVEFLRELMDVLPAAGANTRAQDRYKLTAYDLGETENDWPWELEETRRTGLNWMQRARQASANREAERTAQTQRWKREQAGARRRGAARVAALRAQTADLLGQMSRNTTNAAQYERECRQRVARNMARSRQQSASVPSSSSSSRSRSPSISIAGSSSNRSRTAVSWPTPARSSLSSSSSSTSRAPEWSGSAFSACYREAERTRTMGPSEAIKAFKIGCDVVHLLEFSTAGTDRVYCGKSGDLPAKAHGRLADTGLRGYLPFAQRAWNVWVYKRGCMQESEEHCPPAPAKRNLTFHAPEWLRKVRSPRLGGKGRWSLENFLYLQRCVVCQFALRTKGISLAASVSRPITRSAPRSASIMVGALRLPVVIAGMAELSITRRP